jgi:type IV pilus assembly protein PilY1
MTREKDLRVPYRYRTASKAAACAALALSVLGSGGAEAGFTAISDVPLASGNSVSVKPNILFVLDDSGSMGWTHMPDNVDADTGKVGYRNSSCNLIYYNPNINYLPPKNSDGTNFPQSPFTGAKNDGYLGTTTTDLSTVFFAFDNNTSSGNGSDGPQPAYYYVHTGGGALTPTLGACLDSAGASPYTIYPHTFAASDGGTWTKVRVSATSGPGGTDERQNFANWFSYYRERVFMMKAAGSRTFIQLTSNYRVGFITINPGSPVSANKYLPIADFDVTQKNAWFSKLFSQTVGNSTPLRQALSRAGRHFAGKQDGINNGMTGDPMQYSCQQNFTILTTDGYWNGSGGVKLDGTTAMDQQDGDITVTPRPMYDGGFTAQNTTTDKWNEYRYTTTGCSGGRQKIQYRTWTITTAQNLSGGVPVGSPTTTTTGGSGTFNSPNWIDSTCKNPPVPLPPSDAGVPATITKTSGRTYKRASPTFGGLSGNFEQPTPPAPCTTWPCAATVSATGGSIGALADVAQYYYKTDLRPNGSLGSAVGTPPVQNDVGTDNNVPSSGTDPEDDNNPVQHMTTFTMGLGLAGQLTYRSDYKTATTGDFAQIRSGGLNWPIPVADAPSALDDLWHAAVNGRGQFFSASNPDSVIDSLTTALAGINARVASAAAAATSNLEPVQGDNFAYTAKYTTQEWSGELEAHEIDLSSGAVSPTPIWSAQTKLDLVTGSSCDNRIIWLYRSGATNNLTPFKWNTDTCDALGNPSGAPQTTLNATEQGFFGAAQVAQLSQWGAMTIAAPDQRTLAEGANMVNFLRGQRGLEGFLSGDANRLYRGRSHVLGDIVSAQPVFVRGAIGNYADAGYAAYKLAQAGRTPMVYVGGNDGMLHAFFAGNGTSDPNGGVEAWSFIPTTVLPNLFKLADNNYANQHTYFVDGTPATGDVFDPASSAWKTILVGGLNSGGKSYFALDITDPANPKGLWEFKYSTTCFNPAVPSTHFADCHLGLTFGNPVIAKLADGTWAVFVTSGYYKDVVNTIPQPGDGLGYLYVLNAMTGEILYKIATSAGDAVTPSGLGKISGWVDDALNDNTVRRVYGVDLLGNIWRFDVNDVLGPAGRESQLLATAKDPLGVPQPITTKPELGEAGSPAAAFVFVATGQYLASSDITNTQTNSVYAIRDPLTATTYPDLRTALAQNQLTVVTVNGQPARTASCLSNCTSLDGWFVDLPVAGERVNVDPKLQLGTLVIPSNIPTNSACTIGGESFVYAFNYKNGLALASSPGGVVGTKLSDSLVVGINIVRLPDGKTVVIATTSDAKQQNPKTPFDITPPAGKRVNWREIQD